MDAEEEFYDAQEALTHRQAAERIKDWEIEEERAGQREEMEREEAHRRSEEGILEEALIKVDLYTDYTREASQEEISKAWEVLKSRKPEVARLTSNGGWTPELLWTLTEVLEELYPSLVKPNREGVLWHNYCENCRGQIEIMAPKNPAGCMRDEDIVAIVIQCPHCKRQTGVNLVNSFAAECPNCSQKLSIPKSEIGQEVDCPECKLAFMARQTPGTKTTGEGHRATCDAYG